MTNRKLAAPLQQAIQLFAAEVVINRLGVTFGTEGGPSIRQAFGGERPTPRSEEAGRVLHPGEQYQRGRLKVSAVGYGDVITYAVKSIDYPNVNGGPWFPLEDLFFDFGKLGHYTPIGSVFVNGTLFRQLETTMHILDEFTPGSMTKFLEDAQYLKQIPVGQQELVVSGMAQLAERLIHDFVISKSFLTGIGTKLILPLLGDKPLGWTYLQGFMEQCLSNPARFVDATRNHSPKVLIDATGDGEWIAEVDKTGYIPIEKYPAIFKWLSMDSAYAIDAMAFITTRFELARTLHADGKLKLANVVEHTRAEVPELPFSEIPIGLQCQWVLHFEREDSLES